VSPGAKGPERPTDGRGPVRDYSSLVEALVARQGALSRRLAQIAQFCLNNPEDVAINNIVGLACLIGVAPANITRFAKEMGFTGFAELQEVFRQRLVGPRTSYADRMTALAGGTADLDLDQPGAVFDTFVQSAVDSLLRLHSEVDRNTLDRFVDVLLEAEAVHVVAARGAFGIGAYSLYGLSRVGKRAHLIDNMGAMRAEQAGSMGERDVLLALTFDDYTPETVEVARAVAGRGRRVVAITDNELSPMVGLADPILFVKEARLGHFRSQVPALVLCQSVIVSLGRRIERS
jgi:DNA-binding MurR/RpiR family transcriptional regulator